MKRKPKKPTRPQVYLHESQANRIRPLAAADRRSLSAMVSILVDEALAARAAADRAKDGAP